MLTWLGRYTTELLQNTNDRVVRRDMITNACDKYGRNRKCVVWLFYKSSHSSILVVVLIVAAAAVVVLFELHFYCIYPSW